jgi:hypothetical protein
VPKDYAIVSIGRKHPIARPFALCLITAVYVGITISYWRWAVPALAIFIGLQVARARMRRWSA